MAPAVPFKPLLRAAKRSVRSARRAPGLAYTVSDVPWLRGGRRSRVIALTFDDGPDPEVTPRVLDVLGHYGVPGTFFMLGRGAAAHPDIVERVAAEGHEVACHTWDHPDMTTLDDAGFETEVDATNRLLESISGRAVGLVRPPEGVYDRETVRRLHDRGLVTMLWSIATKDWQRPGPAVIVDRVAGHLHSGGVVVMHDLGQLQSVEALPTVIEQARARGFEFISLGRPVAA